VTRTSSKPARPAKLSPAQQRLALAAIKDGLMMDEVARALGVHERTLWRSIPWDSIDSAIQAGIVRNLDAAAERLQQELPACRALLAGKDAAATAPANGEARAPKRPRRPKRKRRKAKPKQADDQPQPEFSELWTAAHVRRECELPDGPPEFPTPRRAGGPECEVTADAVASPDGAECQAEEADGQGQCFRDESTTG
jgi:hypothetical protein